VVADQSLNVPVNGAEPDGGELLSGVSDDGDPIRDPSAVDPEDEKLIDRASALIESALPALDERQRRIVEARWLSGENVTLGDLGREFGVSRERVRQNEQAAFKKIRSTDNSRGEIDRKEFVRKLVCSEFSEGNRLSRSMYRHPRVVQLTPTQNRARIAKEDAR